MSDWWNRAMTGQQPARTATPQPRQFQQPSWPATGPMPGSQAPVPAAEPPRRRAPHELHSSTCPMCGSGNYMSVQGAKPRCYDCGYPVEQTTSGLGGSHDASLPTHKAEQVSGTGFNPGQIIGRVE